MQFELKISGKTLISAIPLRIICIFLGLVTLSLSANAQVDAGALQQNLERQLPTPSPLPFPEPSKPEKEPLTKKAGSDDVKFIIKGFVLEGVNLLPESTVQGAIKDWVGKEVTFSDLQKVTDRIIELYRKNGFTVQAILPPQKIANGLVKILVTEAKLSEVVVDAPSGYPPYASELAAKFITYANPIGEPLNMENLEHALIIVNETPGLMATSQLEPGKKVGETAVRLKMTEPPSNIMSRVELNNYGSRTTGANQAVVSANFSGIGEQAAINGIASDGSGFVQGSYMISAFPNGLRMGINASYLNYKNVSNYASPNGGVGDAWTTGISAIYPLTRSQLSNLNATINYDIKSYMNKNSVTQSVISSYNIKNLSVGLNGNHFDTFGGRGINVGSVSLVFGTLENTGESAVGYGLNNPSTFTKFVFSGNRTQQLTADDLTSFYLAISGQLASGNLNSAEQFYLGGPYGVRAYPVAQSPGAQGGLVNAELRHQLPKNLTVSAFFDAGTVQQYKNLYSGWQGLTNANNTYSLMGAGLGLKWVDGPWNVNGSVAWKVGNNPLYNQTGQAVSVDGTSTNPRGWVSASYTF